MLRMRHNIFSVMCIVYSVLGLVSLHIWLIINPDIPVGMYGSLLIFALLILALGVISDMLWMKDSVVFYSKKINKIYRRKANTPKPCGDFKITYPAQECIRIECDGNIGKFSGQSTGLGIAVLADDMIWEKHNGSSKEDDILHFIQSIHRCSISQRNEILCFYNNQNKLIKFKWDGTPLAIMKEGNIESIETDCICKTFENTTFDSVDEFERFQNYICYLLFTGELKEPRVLFFRRKNKKPIEKYECAKCKSAWVLEYPGSSSNGAWKKVNQK